MPSDVDRGADSELDIRYVLLTECLQNDFFLTRECRLYLGDQAALSMLVGRDAEPRLGAAEGSPSRVARSRTGHWASLSRRSSTNVAVRQVAGPCM